MIGKGYLNTRVRVPGHAGLVLEPNGKEVNLKELGFSNDQIMALISAKAFRSIAKVSKPANRKEIGELRKNLVIEPADEQKT